MFDDFVANKQAGSAAIFAATVGVILSVLTSSVIPAAAGGVAALLLLLSIHVADQWEKCVVLRFGRYHARRGPGMFLIVPIVDRVSAVIDERVRTTAVHSEVALTRDTLRVNVDAVVFWQVWDAGKAALEVRDFDEAVALVAQTSLFEAIGRHQLAEMLAGRDSIGRDLQQVLEQKTTAWGITVQSVEIRDIRLPRDLENVMSRQAQAERERQARIILGGTEVELAARFAEASVAYKTDPTALHLRAMNILYEAIKEKGTMVVVPASSLRPRARKARRGAAIVLLALSALASVSAQQAPAPPPPVPVDPIGAIIDAFRTHPVVALSAGVTSHRDERGEAFAISLVHDPRSAAAFNDLVIESPNARYQDAIDRYVRGEAVPDEVLRHAWDDTTQQQFPGPIWTGQPPPICQAVRDVNRSLPRERQFRILFGDPPIDWDQVHSRDDFA